MSIRVVPFALAMVLAGLQPGPRRAAAQELPDTVRGAAPQERPDTSVLPQPPISPRSAFLRALAVPGWGHASLGSYTRGGFYFATEATTAWMLVRIAHRRAAARDVRVLRIQEVEARAGADGVTDPAAVQALVDADEGVIDARRLEDARGQQFQDWLALGIFLVLMGGADAYVSAHLSGFPEPVEVQPQMLAPHQVGVAVRVPVGPPGR